MRKSSRVYSGGLEDVSEELVMNLGWSRTMDMRYPWLKVGLLGLLVVVMVTGMSVMMTDGAEAPRDVHGAVVEENDQSAREGDDAGEVLDASEVDQIEPPETKKVRLDAGQKMIALTFDDGPSPANTPRLLDMLEEMDVKATFFLLGSLVARYPDIVGRMATEGHQVGSHSYSHADLSGLGAEALAGEIGVTRDAIVAATGQELGAMRPPYGAIDDEVRAAAGMPIILWSVDPQDWVYRDSATVHGNVMAAAHDGAIVLLHDLYGSSVDAVPGIVSGLREQGYVFVTVEEMIATRGTRIDGEVYRKLPPW